VHRQRSFFNLGVIDAHEPRGERAARLPQLPPRSHPLGGD
jgi:hypothetical protein